jgi:hypothetical protein
MDVFHNPGLMSLYACLRRHGEHFEDFNTFPEYDINALLKSKSIDSS